MTPSLIESQAIARVVEDYRRRGYDVAIKPGAANLPEFLVGYRPDIIARGPDESVIIEVKVGTRTSVAERFREIAEQVSRQPGWRFSLVYVSPSEPDQLTEADPAPLPAFRSVHERPTRFGKKVGPRPRSCSFGARWKVAFAGSGAALTCRLRACHHRPSYENCTRRARSAEPTSTR